MSDQLTDDRILEIFAKSKGSKGTQLLGFSLIESNIAAGTVKATFMLDDRFENPMGSVQGGFLVAALDEVMTVAVIVKSGLTILAPSLEIKANYIKSVKPGLVEAEGRVVRLGKSVAFLEGTLFNDKGEPAVTATATCLVRPRPQNK